MFRKQMFQVLVVLIGMVLVGGVAFSAAPVSKAITLNPLGFVLGAYNANYEVVTGNQSSIVGSGIFMHYGLGDASFTSIGGGASYRYYTKGGAPNGFYVGPSVSIASATVEVKTIDWWTGDTQTDSANVMVFGVGATAGHQWILDSGLVFNLQAGLTASFGNTSIDEDDINVGGVAPSFGFALGYAW